MDVPQILLSGIMFGESPRWDLPGRRRRHLVCRRTQPALRARPSPSAHQPRTPATPKRRLGAFLCRVAGPVVLTEPALTLAGSQGGQPADPFSY